MKWNFFSTKYQVAISLLPDVYRAAVIKTSEVPGWLEVEGPPEADAQLLLLLKQPRLEMMT